MAAYWCLFLSHQCFLLNTRSVIKVSVSFCTLFLVQLDPAWSCYVYLKDSSAVSFKRFSSVVTWLHLPCFFTVKNLRPDVSVRGNVVQPHSSWCWRTFLLRLWQELKSLFLRLKFSPCSICPVCIVLQRQTGFISPGLLNQKSDSIIKWHLTYSCETRGSQRRCWGLSGVFTGTLMDDVSRHNLGRHPALRVNDLHISALKMNVSICGRYRHRHVHRRLDVHEGLVKSQWEAVKWSEGKFLLCSSSVQQTLRFTVVFLVFLNKTFKEVICRHFGLS